MNNGTTYNYHNQVEAGATGQFRVTGNTTATGGAATGILDQTSVPTIVKPEVVFAPEPIVVNPEVVNPVIVQ